MLSTASTSDRSISSSFRSFNVVKQLGQGSYGKVYLVQDEKGKHYAVKQIKIDPFNFQESQKQIQVMKKLCHQNLIRIYDYSIEKDKQIISILMEYCEEGDLFKYYKKKQKNLSVNEILKILKQIVKAFISMNVRGVFHRDLKPQNILLSKGMIVKIADFGCARSITPSDMTVKGNFSQQKGTPLYASPEQLMNEKYSSKCDVWSAGVLLFLIYYGYHPFMDPKISNILVKIKDKTQNKTIQIPEDSDPTIAKIIHATLIYQDQQRASWRQLWLSRVFTQKISDVKNYVQYLHKVSGIANTMTRNFWVARKPFQISRKKDEVFIYFFIKFQCTIMLQGKQINKRNKKHEYLFQKQSYKNYNPDEAFMIQIKKDYLDRQRFLNTIKKIYVKQISQQINKIKINQKIISIL